MAIQKLAPDGRRVMTASKVKSPIDPKNMGVNRVPSRLEWCPSEPFSATKPPVITQLIYRFKIAY
mgnify:CR=1 FL=1